MSIIGTIRELVTKSRASSCLSLSTGQTLKEALHQKDAPQRPRRQRFICTLKTSRRSPHLPLMPITYRQIQSEESCCRPFLCIVSIHPSLIMLVVQDKPIQLSSSHLFSMSTIYQKRITERTGHPTNFSALANEFRRCARCHPILYSHRILTALCQSPQQSSPSRPIQCASKT